jgi:hypothetical protein
MDAQPVKEIRVYEGRELVASAGIMPPAKPDPDTVFNAAFDRIMRGQPAYAPPVPAGESFEAACSRLLHQPGAPLPRPWRTAEVTKAMSEIPMNLARYQSGRFG